MSGFASDLPDVIAALAAWYRAGHRELPWRSDLSPYRVLVSEIMLQQTQVDTVVPFFERFLKHFPDVHALACANEDEILKLWEGLGYYRRARHLHAAAKAIDARGGQWPRDVRELATLPGVGRSTAGAIASIAFGVRAPILDGNVKRVWCRLASYDAVPQGANLKPLWSLSESAVRLEEPGVVNQALMELGATVCRRSAPACGACPVRMWCRALRENRVAELPRSKPRPPRPLYDVSVAILWRDGRFAVTRRRIDGLLGGLWELPGGKWEPGEDAREALRRELQEELRVRVEIGEGFEPIRHAYSHFQVVLHPFSCRLPRGERPVTALPLKWLRPEEIPSLAFPAGTLKIFKRVFGPRMERAAEEAGAWEPGGPAFRGKDDP